MSNYLDIDFLKSTGCKPKWFGLGFIQLAFHDRKRMHFWHPDLPPDSKLFENEYHDHRYDFRSDILVGELTNHLIGYKLTEESPQNQFLWSVCCHGETPPKPIGEVLTWPLADFTICAGGSYFLKAEQQHRVSVNRCVTLQTRSEENKDRALIISSAEFASPNPFDRTIPENDLWEVIDDLITHKHGYHIAQIEKGELGESSKIVEEVNEFLDAVDQGVQIMQLVELSDLMGAVQAWLSKHTPQTTIDDLLKMSAVTRRAFVNGFRS